MLWPGASRRGEWRRARQRQLAVLAILLFCYSAILLFRRPAVPFPPASPLYRQRCGMVRIPCDIDTRATHTTTHTQNESAGPGNGRRCPGYAVARIGSSRAAVAAMDERALQCKFLRRFKVHGVRRKGHAPAAVVLSQSLRYAAQGRRGGKLAFGTADVVHACVTVVRARQ